MDAADRPGTAVGAAPLHGPARRPAGREHGRTRLTAEGHGARRSGHPASAPAAPRGLRLRTHRPRTRVAAGAPGPRHLGRSRARRTTAYRRRTRALVRTAPAARAGGGGTRRSAAGGG